MDFLTDYKGLFGVELEFTAFTRHLANRYGTFHDHVFNLCDQSGLKGWKINKDGSCGHELVSPKLKGQTGMNLLMEACVLCEKARIDFGQDRIVGFDTGVHYHYDATSFDIRFLRNIVIITAALEPMILLMNPHERNNLCYAGPMNVNLYQMMRVRDEIDLKEQWFRHYNGNIVANSHQGNYGVKFWNGNGKGPHKYDYTRYHGFNLVAYWHHGSVEFRYTHGTFNQEIIFQYFRLYQAMVEAAAALKTPELLAIYPCSKSEVRKMSMQDFHTFLISDMPRLLSFVGKLIKPDVSMWKFIATRLFKHNWRELDRGFIKMILGFPDDGDPKELGRKIRHFTRIGTCRIYSFGSRQNKLQPHAVFGGENPLNEDDIDN
jgi:hypothetical protein